MATKISLQHRSLKVKLDLTDDQKLKINQALGNTRFWWNYCLNHKNEFFESIKNLPKSEQKEKWKEYKKPSYKEFLEEFSFLNILTPKECYQQKQRDLDQAYNNFFLSLSGKRKGRKVNEPKFKKKSKRNDSFRCCMISINCFDWYHRTVILPIFGKVRFRHAEDKSRKWINWFLEAKPCNITVSRDKVGDYYCSILFEKEGFLPLVEISNDENQVIGLDFSPSKMYVDSNSNTGKDFGYKPFKQSNKRLKRLQRSFSGKKGNKKGEKKSKNFEKARIKVAKVERKIANQRRDFQEKESLRLVREYETICIENLNLQGISKFLPNAKNINDVGWGHFIQLLERKSIFNNCIIIKADKWHPSSKTCHLCEHVNHDLKLSVRTYNCSKCGFSIDRDLNAALNLKSYAISEIVKYLPLEQGEVKSVENTEGEMTHLRLSGVFDFEAERNRSDSVQRSHLL